MGALVLTAVVAEIVPPGWGASESIGGPSSFLVRFAICVIAWLVAALLMILAGWSYGFLPAALMQAYFFFFYLCGGLIFAAVIWPAGLLAEVYFCGVTAGLVMGLLLRQAANFGQTATAI
jgi:hypothetical protein